MKRDWRAIPLPLLALAVCAFTGGCLPPSGDLSAERGLRHYARQEYEEAIADLKLAGENGVRKYDLEDVYTVIGNSYNELRDFEQSIEWHRKALEVNPRSYKAWVNLGVVYRLTEEFDEAEKCYQQALEINPNYAELHASLGALHVYRDEPQRAIKSLERAIDLDDSLAVAHANLAMAYAMNEQFEEAHRSLKAALVRGYQNGPVVRDRIDALEAAAN